MEAIDPFDAVNADAGYLRPRLRPDLRIVYESGDNSRTKARIRIADPVSGKQYSFTEQEHRLCQLANGRTSLREIHAAFQGSGSAELPAREVIAFFRRLHILGLLTSVPEFGSEPRPELEPETDSGDMAGRMPDPASEAEPANRPPRTGRLKAHFPTASAARRNAPRRLAPAATQMPHAGTAETSPQTLSHIPPDAREAAVTEAAPHAANVAVPPPEMTVAAAEPPVAAPVMDAVPASEATPAIAISVAPPAPALAVAAADTLPDPVSASRVEARPAAEPVPETTGGAALPVAAALVPLVQKTQAAPGPMGEKAGVRAYRATGPASPSTVTDFPKAGKPARPVDDDGVQAGMDTGAASRKRRPRVGRAVPVQPETGMPAADPKPAAAAMPEKVAPGTDADDPLSMIAGNLADHAAIPRAPLFDDEDEAIFGGAMGGMGGGIGGGMGGRMGGMGGLGGGGMGAMGGGGANRERIMAALAARKAGGGKGGMFGAKAAATAEDIAPVPHPVSLTLYNPTLLLRLLYIVFYPTKFLFWLLVPAVVIAGLTMAQNWGELLIDRAAFTAEYSALTLLMISLFVANFTARLAQGVGIIAHGGKVSGMGLMLVFGFMPRFFIDTSAITDLDRRGQLWAHGAPMLARLALFVFGIMVWAITRDSGSWLSQMGLIVGLFGLGMFLFSAFPLHPSDGKNWIATYLNEPRVLNKSFGALRHVLTGQPLPPFIERRDLWPLVFFAVGTILTLAALALGLLVTAALFLEAEYSGTGVAVFLVMVTSFVIWLFALKMTLGRKMAAVEARHPGLAFLRAAGAGPAGDAAPKAMLGRIVDPSPDAVLGIHPAAQAKPAAASASSTARVVWGVVGMALLAVAFLPYQYEAGGQVEILPLSRGQAVARSDGEIIDILVSEGDTVTEGQVLAHLSSWDQENEVAVTQAKLDGAAANLARLQSGPKPEEVELARRQVASSEASVAFSRAEADRARELAASGTVSQQNLEKANSTYNSDLADLEVARANLELVQSGATDDEISVAEAAVEQLTQELAYRKDEVERTLITAPMDGRVITADLELRHGGFLRVGEPLLEIENAQVVNAAISVPESDISLIERGGTVRFKAWGQSDREIIGVVQDIAPAASDEPYGSVVRVEAVFQNPDYVLRSGMTGYAKIQGTQMRVWEAYLRSIRRFFQIEVWSWIP